MNMCVGGGGGTSLIFHYDTYIGLLKAVYILARIIYSVMYGNILHNNVVISISTIR